MSDCGAYDLSRQLRNNIAQTYFWKYGFWLALIQYKYQCSLTAGRFNTAPRALIPQLTSLILYSCKSKLDCWSLFCSLARTVIGSH